MEIYLKVVHKEIMEIYTEELFDGLELHKIKTLEEFYDKAGKYIYTDEIESKVKDLLDDNEEDIDPLSLFDIKHWVSNRSFGELIDMYENDEIIKPNMQRSFVWNSLKCSRFIESIILGLPIPPLFLLEVAKNKYELIDGYQRLTTVFNFVKGNPWGGAIEGKKNVTSKLSSKISKDLQNKTFKQLNTEYQRTIRRSTLPLIEFKQLEPSDLSSKYLIYERINTGSEKLNQMQIRKSLVYGNFIDSLYKTANSNQRFVELFSSSSLKKDVHVESYLRILAMSEIAYGTHVPMKTGINNILNGYCEKHKQIFITEDLSNEIDNAVKFALDVFPDDKTFRRVNDVDGELILTGNLNVSILESFIGVCIKENVTIESEEVLSNYKTIMMRTNVEDDREIHENPFTTHTGAKQNIIRRYEVMKEIMGLV